MSSMQVPTQTHYKHQLEAGRSSFDQFLPLHAIAMERYCRRMMSVCLSVRDVGIIPDHMCWATWNFITRLISSVSSLAACKISAI